MRPGNSVPSAYFVGGRTVGFGAGRGGLHIRPGSVIEESAESCGNAPALNTGGILPCAERASPHMGERHREADDSRKSRNHAEN